MGLDVYLTYYENYERSVERATLYGERCRELYARKLPDEQEREMRQAIEAELGLDDWGDDPTARSIELPSRIDPEHMFKVGYFRSSYNDGGLNNLARRLLGSRGLYAVFPEAEGEERVFRPDWPAAKQRALDMANALEDRGASFPYDVIEAGRGTRPADDAPTSAAGALEVYRRQSSGSPFGAFSCALGDFFVDESLPVRALILGTRERFGHPEPVMYVVHETGKRLGWYVTALRIVAETCDYVLKQSDREKYWIRWSA